MAIRSSPVVHKDYPWGVFAVEGGTTHVWPVGDREIWMECKETDVLAAVSGVTGSEELHRPAPGMWARYMLKKPPNNIHIEPLFPDRPVVVRPEMPFYLTKNTERRIYIQVPLWFSVYAESAEKQLLIQEPSVILSNTWFGSMFAGRLCYWVSAAVSSRDISDTAEPHLAVCSLQLSNTSRENLFVDSLSIPVTNAALFMYHDRLFSDTISIQYRGKNEPSRVSFSSRAPKQYSGAVKVQEPRRKEKKNLLIKSFELFTDMQAVNLPGKL